MFYAVFQRASQIHGSLRDGWIPFPTPKNWKLITNTLHRAPLTESPRLGRRPVLLGCAFLFVLACLGQALVREGQWNLFLFLRFMGGVVGSPPISVFGGVIADLYEDLVKRGRVMMYW